MANDQKPVISVRKLRKVYMMGQEHVVALHNIDLDIPRGEVCCIFGTSGSGKSTLLNQLAGLEKPTRGVVRIGGVPISLLNDNQLAAFRQKHIGFVFQSYNLLPELTAAENVAMPLMFKGIDPDVRLLEAKKMLCRVGLKDRRDHFPNQMSGGQQQRVGIARAFVTRPEVVFADEPTGNLDSKTTKEVMHMIRGFAKRFHQTIVLVSHDPEMTEYAARIVTLIDGRIVSNVENQVKAEIDAAPYIEYRRKSNMKRISRSLLSLCLALVLCAALLPVNVAKETGGGTTAQAGTSFLITGYRASRSSIYTGDTVDITVYLSRTDGSNDSIRVVRGLDSFQDGTASAVASGQNGEYTVTFTGLTYTGDSGKQLAFTIYYEGNGGGYQDGNTVPVRECVPYTEPKPEPEPTPETIPEPRAVFNSDGTSTSIAAGETKTITVYIQNAGTTAMRDPILTLKSSGSLLIMGSQDYMLDDIRAGRDTAGTVTVKAPDKIESQMQTIDASLSFYYDNGTQLTGGSASGSVNVLSTVTKDTKDEETIASPTPIVILSKYNYGGSSVAAGSSTNLSFSFTNTSKTIKIENVMVTVTGGQDLMLNGSTNTFYFESVAASGSKTVTVPMKAAQLISASAQDGKIDVTYEYVDQNARKSGNATLSLSVPLYQPDRFELSEPKTSYTGYVGEETSLTIDYVNKGKSAINNVEATISGDIDSPTPYQRVGTIDGGKNGTIAFAVTPQLEGENQVKIVITYEDSNGNTKERVFEATVEAMAYEPAAPGMDDPGMIAPAPARTFPWKYVIIAVVAALIVLLIVLRIRKKKAKQKAEQALWDKWDEEELAEEKQEAAEAAAAESKETAATGAEEQKK